MGRNPATEGLALFDVAGLLKNPPGFRASEYDPTNERLHNR
jgi:hypothetical protein